MNGWTCTRITRTNERMAGLVRLRDFKLDRVQVRPMADVAKLPCDSGFALSACLSLSASPGLSVSRFTQLRKRQRRKLRKTATTIVFVNVGTYFAYEVQRTKRERLRKFSEKRNKLTRLGIQRGSLARSKEYKGKARDKGRDGERISAVAGRISSNACLQGRKREPQLMRRKGQKARRYT